MTQDQLNNGGPVILLVEDSPEDFVTTVRAFDKANLGNPIHRVEDGDEALDYLKHEGKYTDPKDAPSPNVILLDLNLPGIDGRDLLKELKADDRFKRIPIIVLTTSTDENDIQKCYLEGANSYIQKPVDFQGLVDAIQRLNGYWFELSVLPMRNK